jgi:hypothetical protein
MKQHGENGYAANIGLAIVGQTVVNSTFVLLFGFCAKVGLTFFKFPTIAKPKTVGGNCTEQHCTNNSPFEFLISFKRQIFSLFQNLFIAYQ